MKYWLKLNELKADVAYLLSETGKKTIIGLHVNGILNFIKDN